MSRVPFNNSVGWTRLAATVAFGGLRPQSTLIFPMIWPMILATLYPIVRFWLDFVASE